MFHGFNHKVVQIVRGCGLDHDTLSSITVINGVMINRTPLRVGKGRGELGEVDLPVIRDHRGVVFIPASSLKGALRALGEALSRGSGYEVCTPHTQDLCSFKAELLNTLLQRALLIPSIRGLASSLTKEVDEIINRRLRRFEEEFRRRIKEELTEILNKIANASSEEEGFELLSKFIPKYVPCVVCQIFGNQALAARITIHNAYPENSLNVKTSIYTRVSIDRFRDAAKPGALFEYEYIPPGHRWRIRIELKNLDIRSCTANTCKLLLELLRHFTLGITVGSMKSIGLGLIELIPNETFVIVYKVKNFRLEKEYEVVLSSLLGGFYVSSAK